MFDKLSEAVGIKKKARLYFDTNALLLMGSKGIDVFTDAKYLVSDNVEPSVVDGTLVELRRIIDGVTGANKKDRFNAKLGYILVKQKGLKVVKSSSKDRLVDDALVRLSDDKTYVVTLDRDLQKRLMKKNVRIITVRQNRLVFLQR